MCVYVGRMASYELSGEKMAQHEIAPSINEMTKMATSAGDNPEYVRMELHRNLHGNFEIKIC